jgi:hypothetical protein
MPYCKEVCSIIDHERKYYRLQVLAGFGSLTDPRCHCSGVEHKQYHRRIECRGYQQALCCLDPYCLDTQRSLITHGGCLVIVSFR